MSKHHTEIIRCPICAAETKFTIWESVNAELDPVLKEMILKGDIFRTRCRICGEEFYCTFDFLYHDMKSNTMLFFVSEEPEKGRHDFWNMPKVGIGEYSLRVVFGYGRLLEKMLILDTGLKDVAIERMKYMISRFFRPEIFKKGYQLYYKGWKPQDNLKQATCQRCGEIYFSINDAKGKLEDLTLDMSMYYEQEKAVSIDPRMKISGWQCIDDEWMDMMLRRIE